MAQVNLILPKLHVFFKTSKTPAQVRSEVLGPLANGYENLIQNYLDGAGQTGLTVEVVRNPGKVYREGARWTVYLKGWVYGESTLTDAQIWQGWNNKKADIKAAAKARLERAAFGGTELSFKFRRLDNLPAEEEI